MDEIKELDNKYLVLKWDDIEKYLTPRGLKRPLMELDGIITLSRRIEGKTNDNRYVVLNLDDDVSLMELNGRLQKIIAKRISDDIYHLPIKVKDIAVDLVNAILKTKQERD